MCRKGLLAVGLTIGTLIASTGSAQAAVTIGSNLAGTPAQNAPGCAVAGFPCTAVNVSLPPTSLAEGGLTSPVNGTVTSWRARANTNNVSDDLSLQVLRRVSGTTYMGVSTSAPQNWPPEVSPPLATSQPIQIGDSLALRNPMARLIYANTLPGQILEWHVTPEGPLGDGQTRPADTIANQREVLVQATIEPTNTLAFGAVTRNRKKGTAKVAMSVPNAGELIYSGNGLVISGPPKVAAAGDIKVGVRAFRRNREKLVRKGRLRVSFQVSFQPSFGSLRTATEKLTLRKKQKK